MDDGECREMGWDRIEELNEENERLRADLATSREVTVMQADRSVKQRKEIQDLQDEIERLKAERRWISPRKRVPEQGQKVIVVINGNITEWIYSACFFDIFLRHVSGWIPMPEPPEVDNA